MYDSRESRCISQIIIFPADFKNYQPEQPHFSNTQNVRTLSKPKVLIFRKHTEIEFTSQNHMRIIICCNLASITGELPIDDNKFGASERFEICSP